MRGAGGRDREHGQPLQDDPGADRDAVLGVEPELSWSAQASTAASNPTVTDDAGVATITAANDLRIRIPAGLSMTWDTTVTTVTLSGTASGKVSTTLGAYEDSNQTLVLNVTSNFAVGDTLTISGLKFNNFTAASSGNLQLVVAGAGGATMDTDNRSKTIGAPSSRPPLPTRASWSGRRRPRRAIRR